jgi:stearoyl-CoA desaturase (delta-9 desaturase)
VHATPLLAFVTGVSVRAVVLCVALYVVRMFFVTAGFHCYFSHRSYRLGRVAQAVFAYGGLTAAQKGPLWWAGTHRRHHWRPDGPDDVHSPRDGLWWSHVGWLLTDSFDATDAALVEEFADHPEIRWMNDHDWVGPIPLAIGCWLVAGWSGLVVGFFCSTLLLWHATFLVNSAAHRWGRRRYPTPDDSRNNVVVAFLTLGGGWHNNHHRYPASARHGHRWWELDVTFTVLRLLAKVGIVTQLRNPPAHVLARPPGGRSTGG